MMQSPNEESDTPTKGAAAAPQKKPFTVVLMTIYSVENAGIRYVSAALQREGFDVHIIFLRDWVHNKLTMPTDEEFQLAMDIIQEKGADLIGVGLMSSLYPMALEATKRMKVAFPHIPIMWGGIHPTSVPEECIGDVDYLCVGEGEMAAVDLCAALRDGRDTTNIPNIWANIDGQIYQNAPRPLIQDLQTGCPIQTRGTTTNTTLKRMPFVLKSLGSVPRNTGFTFRAVAHTTVPIAMSRF